MALTGQRDTRDIVVKTGTDAAELRKYQIADGTTFESIVSLMTAGLAGVRNEITTDPVYGSLISVSENPEITYRMGTNGAMEAFSEFAKPLDQRAQTDGHMLPLKAYDRGLGWTWRYLEKAILEDVQADITAALNSIRDRYRVNILTRVLKRTDDSGAANGLGSSGYSPGFATTAASTSVDFTPPDFGGKSFASTHEHYNANAGSSGAITTTELKAMREHLREHGHVEPYELLISADDRAVYEALSGFVFAIDSAVQQYASTASLATVRLADGYIGYILGFKVRIMPGMPRYWHFGYKSYGINSPLNPVRIRTPKGFGGALDLRILTDGASPADPLRGLTVFTEFGVGVKDRTAGTTYYTNSGTWADGTPT